MTSIPKPAKSFAEQLKILKDRGLIVSIVSMGFPSNWRQLPMWVDSIQSVPSVPL